MKAPAPPPPKGVPQGSGHETVLSKYSAIVYVHEDKTWKPLYDKYTSLLCCDYGGEELNERYSLNTYVGEQRILQYFITSSTKVKIKESFVRCQNDRLIVGARFKSEEVAKNYHHQLTEILSEICPYAKINKNPKKAKDSAVPVVEKSPPAKETKRQPSVVQIDDQSMVSIAPKRENSLVENGVSTFAPGPYERRRESNLNKEQINYDYRRGSAVSAIKKDPNKTQVTDARRGSASSVKKETEIRRDSASSTDTRKELKNVANSYNVRRESAPVKMKSDTGGRRDTGSLSKATTVQKQVVIEEKQPYLSDAEDPIWRTFLGLVNLQSAELSNPRVASVVKKFVLERGGDTFLRQVSDQKLSPRLVDDLNSLAGQVHAITEQPVAHKPPVKPERPPSASRQTSQPAPSVTTELPSATGGNSETSTLDRRTKNKRRAPPPPPVRSKSLQNLVDEEEKSPAEEVELGRTATVSGRLASGNTSPVGKRKAPSVPPVKASPPNTVSDKKPHDTSYPNFVAPPPPSGPPPDESIGSPVGPLSPGSAGPFIAKKTDDVTTVKTDLTEEQKNAVAQLDMVICAEEETLVENDDEVFKKTEDETPGTPTIKKNENQQIVGKVILSADVKTEPLSVETTVKQESTKEESENKVEAPSTSPPINDTQLQLQQQLLALQAQVSQQEQMLLAAGLLKKKDDVVVAAEISNPTTPSATPPGTVKAKSDVIESKTVETKKSSVIVAQAPTPVVETKKVEEKVIVKAPPPVASKPPPPVAAKPKPVKKSPPHPVLPPAPKPAVPVVKKSPEPVLPPAPKPAEPVADLAVELELPPPPPELLEDTIVGSLAPSPVPSPVSSPPQERYERIISLSPKKESSKPVPPAIEKNEKPKELDLVDSSPSKIVLEAPKSVAVEPPKPVVVEPPKSVAVEPPKPVAVEPPKPVAVEPPKPIAVEPPKPVAVEPSKPIVVEPPKPVAVEPPKPVLVEPPKPVAVEPPKPVAVEPPKPVTVEPAKVPEVSATPTTPVSVPISVSTSPPETPKLTPQASPKSSSPSPDGANKYSVTTAGGVGKKPMSGLYAKLKARTAAKGGKMPISTNTSTAKTAQLPPPVIKPTPKPVENAVKTTPPVTKPATPAPVKADPKPSASTGQPIGLGSLINSEPVTVTRKEQLKISDPSTMGKKEALKISEPVQKDAVDCGPKSLGIVPHTKNEETPVVKNNTIPETISSEPTEPELKTEISTEVVIEDVVVSNDVIPVESEPTVSEETDQTQTVLDSSVLSEIAQNKLEVETSKPVSVETTNKVEYRPVETDSSSILSTVISNSDLNQPPTDNTEINIPKAAYTNSLLNEVQSKGYQRVSLNGHVDPKPVPNPVVNPTSEVTSPEVSDLDEGVEGETIVYENIADKKLVIDNNCQTNVNGNTHITDVEAILANGDAPVTCFYGDSYNGKVTADVKDDIEALPSPPPVDDDSSPPSVKQIPLQKAISIDKEVPVASEQTVESAKDRMIRNIQERGTPCDEQGLETNVQQPVPNNSIRNTINKVIETTVATNGNEKSVEFVDKTNPLFEDVRGTNNRDKPKPPPAVKPKPKPKMNNDNLENNNYLNSINNNNHNSNNNKPVTYVRHVTEEPGSRQTTNMKKVGSLNIGFARDSSRDVPRTNYENSSRSGSLSRTKMSRSISSDSTSSTESGSLKLSDNVNGGSKMSLQSNIDVDLRSTSARDENIR